MTRQLPTFVCVFTTMADNLDDILKALAHPLRRQVLHWLKDPRGNFPEQTYGFEHGVCAGQIDLRCDLAQSTVSAHLACLQQAGLVKVHKMGPNRFYKRNEEVLRKALDMLWREL